MKKVKYKALTLRQLGTTAVPAGLITAFFGLISENTADFIIKTSAFIIVGGIVLYALWRYERSES